MLIYCVLIPNENIRLFVCQPCLQSDTGHIVSSHYIKAFFLLKDNNRAIKAKQTSTTSLY